MVEVFSSLLIASYSTVGQFPCGPLYWVAIRRSRMPVKSTIFWAGVSRNRSNSSFVRTLAGSYDPVPRIPIRHVIVQPPYTTACCPSPDIYAPLRQELTIPDLGIKDKVKGRDDGALAPP